MYSTAKCNSMYESHKCNVGEKKLDKSACTIWCLFYNVQNQVELAWNSNKPEEQLTISGLVIGVGQKRAGGCWSCSLSPSGCLFPRMFTL